MLLPCCSVKDESGEREYYSIPEQENDGWEISAPEPEGIDIKIIESLLEKIEELTLYTLQQEKRIAELESRLARQ